MSVSWYDAQAANLVTRYEAVDPVQLHRWLRGLIPDKPSTVLDVGAGTGRDAAWFADQGHDVVAVEPSQGMRCEGQRLHSQARIRWVADQLPGLDQLSRLGISFDLVMLTAVWQHVPPSDRERAFRKLAGLVRSGGLLALSLRSGPSSAASQMYPTSIDEVTRFARNHGFAIEKVCSTPDRQSRPDVSWTCVAMRLPDDGTGALPLLRHVILNDQKSATYKLGLLRSLCRVADGSAGAVDDRGEEFIRVPLGLIALNWLRLYLPLVRHGLPQAPTNAGVQGLGFAKDGFRLLLSEVSPSDLMVGAKFSHSHATAVHRALRDAAHTIDRMPATFMTYPGGGRILPVERGRLGSVPDILSLDLDYLKTFGLMRVPVHLWRAMRQNAAWIEPALIAEWTRLMREYATGQERQLAEHTLHTAMRWSDPEREVSRTRGIAISLLERTSLRCVWSDRPLTRTTLDIDHMFPWTAWPCGDLWNLLPAHREVNQRQKRDRLPSASTLSRSEDRIIGWWREGYLQKLDAPLATQFVQEAYASLPGLSASGAEEVFASVCLQRIRLRHDQQVPEWEAGP